MKPIARRLEPLSWLVILIALTQLLPVTRIALWPQKVVISGSDVKVYRFFPGDYIRAPRPHISYVETVKPLTLSHNGGQTCQDNGGPFQYIQEQGAGRWNIEPWAAPCLNDPNGYVWTARWTWHIGGLSVGSVRLSETFFNEAE